MKKNLKTTLVISALAGTLAIGSVMAYFTDGDTAANTFTVGKVSLDLQEPGWVPPTDITPLEEIRKDPQIKNNGANDEYVFMEVVVPYANVTIAAQDGTKAPEKADTELFSYEVKKGWTEIGAPKKDTVGNTMTHLYVYGTAEECKALPADQTTTSIFDYVKFANVIEDEALEGTTQNIVVNAYGIQTTNINDGKTSPDGMNDDGKTSPEEVWAVLSRQAPDTAKEGEAVNTDILP